ncbi:hypothetical protein F5Y16DRAFT_369122 [Xylariaceae sp. FL0255]|nr:hypothetical protein F5Y16DRAFT_369122 [Xylariaceae sp. FL0255]
MPGGAVCSRCKEHDAVTELRTDEVCASCYTAFIEQKVIKRLEVLQRETKSAKQTLKNQGPPKQQRYLLALSQGPSSTALLHVLCENLRRQRARGQRERFEVVGVYVHVDVDAGAGVDGFGNEAVGATPPEKKTDDPLAEHFPEIPIHRIALSSIIGAPEVDWASLPGPNSSSDSAAVDEPLSKSQRLAQILLSLPTPSARADVTRLLTRHALLRAALTFACDVVLLGYNTTALAELTLTEAAKGRGFGVPWLVNDGVFPLPSWVDDDSPGLKGGGSEERRNAEGKEGTTEGIPIYSPLREILRKEILTYLSLASSPASSLSSSFPHLLPLSSSSSTKAPAVISHRDLSLDAVVQRYFVDVEAQYPSVVANVVRTTGKLSRQRQQNNSPATELCGLCGIVLDPVGDERWKGELGEEEERGEEQEKEEVSPGEGGEDGEDGVIGGDGETAKRRKRKLCYGCQRSVKG